MIVALSNQFTVNQTSVQIDTDTSVNIFRRREHIAYRPQSNTEKAAIAFVSNGDLIASNMVSIRDRSASIVNNRIRTDQSYFIIEDAYIYTVQTDKIVVTDQSLIYSGITDPVPLFYKHILNTVNVPRVSSSDFTLQSNVSIVDLQLLDKDFDVLQKNLASIDYDEGIVYHNLTNSYDKENEVYEVYYVKYTIRINNDLFTYTDLMKQENVYTEATFDDLDENLNIINDGRKVYLINESGEDYEITFPSASTYFIRVADKTKISIISMDDLPLTAAWYPRVLGGKFKAIIQGESYTYHISQINEQFWLPEKPYKKVVNEISRVLSKALIKLNMSNIYQNDSESIHIDILVNDAQGNGLIAFTTDSSKHGTLASNSAIYYYWSFANKVGIKSIDKNAGILDIEGFSLLATYEIISTYYFEEKEFGFTTFDLNPIRNDNILNNKLVLFIDPDTTTSFQENTLFYLLVDKQDRVVESDHSFFDNTTILLVNGNPLFYERVPSFIETGFAAQAEIFVDDYSVEGDGVYLILGDMIVDAGRSPEMAIVADARISGGGIIEGELSDAKRLNAEVNWYWDLSMWDGIPYPENASYFVEVPVDVLTGAGGVLTQQQVKDVVDKHTALGVYPIVKAYGIDPFISSVVPGPNSIALTWVSGLQDTTVIYDVYYSTEIDGGWTKANIYPIAQGATTTSYTITGLNTNVIYYMLVIANKIINGAAVPSIGQPIGPFNVGAKDIHGVYVFATKTFGPSILGSGNLSNSFEVI